MSKVVLMAGAKIVGLIEAVEKSGKQYQEVLHTALVQCVAHAAKHGDRSLLARLVGGAILSKQGEVVEQYPGVVSNATSAREIKLWIHEYTPMRFQRVKGSTNLDAIVVSKTALEKGQVYDVETMADNPFWTLQANMDARNREIGLDNIVAIVKGLRKRIDKAMDEGAFTGDPVQVLGYIKALEEVEPPKAVKRRMVKATFGAEEPKNEEALAPADDSGKLGGGLEVAA